MPTAPTSPRPTVSRHNSASSTSRRAPTATRTPHAGSRSAPYMVALSGWPEPVYIDSHGAGAARAARSRSGTPRGSISGPSGDAAKLKQQAQWGASEGMADSGAGAAVAQRKMPPSGGMEWSEHTGHAIRPITPVAGPTITEALYPYLHSNTRPKSTLSSKTHTPSNTPPAQKPYTFPSNPPIPPLALPKSSTSSSTPQARSHNFDRPMSSSRAAFADPRFTPRASVLGQHGGHLRVAPSWTNSVPASASRVLLSKYDSTPAYSSIRTQHPSDRDSEDETERPVPVEEGGRKRSIGVGGRVLQLGSIQGKTQPVILRSTPEVYPPTQSQASIGGRSNWMGADLVVGVATEVYPRDPESLLLWPGIDAGREGVKGSEGGSTSGTQTPIPASPPMESAPTSSRVNRRYHIPALSPEGGGWSPTVPWQDETNGDGRNGSVQREKSAGAGEEDNRMVVD